MDEYYTIQRDDHDQQQASSKSLDLRFLNAIADIVQDIMDDECEIADAISSDISVGELNQQIAELADGAPSGQSKLAKLNSEYHLQT